MSDTITVIGLGPMGQAMARAFVDAGHPVTVWNRTLLRADGLTGVTVADSVQSALAAGDIIVLSLTHYGAMYDILGPHQSRLTGKILVNLSSDTPDRTREAAEWARAQGASFVTGGVMVPATMIGTDSAYVYFSGDRPTFDTVEATLAAIGSARYLGQDPGLAQLYYQAQLTVFLTSLSAILHATAVVNTAGVTASDFVPDALDMVAAIPAIVGPGLGTSIDARSYPGDLSTVTMMGATAAHITETSRSLGIPAGLPAAVEALYDAAIARGHGADDWASVIEVLRP